jgi:hypothetical protein
VPGEHVLELRGRRRVEADLLAARRDRRQHLARARGEQQQVRVGRRLLERLEHPVGRLVVERVGLLDDEDPARGLERRVRRGGDDRLVDVADQQAGRRGRRDPGQVGVRAGAHARGGAVGIAGALGEQRGGELARDVLLAAAGRPGEQVGVRGVAREDRAGVRMLLGAGQRAHAA